MAVRTTWLSSGATMGASSGVMPPRPTVETKGVAGGTARDESSSAFAPFPFPGAIGQRASACEGETAGGARDGFGELNRWKVAWKLERVAVGVEGFEREAEGAVFGKMGPMGSPVDRIGR